MSIDDINQFNDQVENLLDTAEKSRYEWEESDRPEQNVGITESFDKWIDFHQEFYLSDDHELKYIPTNLVNNSTQKITEYVNSFIQYLDGYALAPCGILCNELFTCRSLKCDTLEEVVEQLRRHKESGKRILLYSIKFVGKRPEQVVEESESIASSGNKHKFTSLFPITDKEYFKIRFASI